MHIYRYGDLRTYAADVSQARIQPVVASCVLRFYRVYVMADPLDELPVPRDLQIPRGRLPAGGDAVAARCPGSQPVASTDLLARDSYWSHMHTHIVSLHGTQ